MVRWLGAAPRLEGFTYYPLLEVGFGCFLAAVCWIPLFLHIRFNGLSTKNYPEWIFGIGFLVFFLWMAKALIFQSFQARVRQGVVFVTQNLREPEVSFERKLEEIAEWRIGAARDERLDRDFKTLSVVVTGEGPKELYRSVNSGEIHTICEALQALTKGAGG
jgi:hypothetical protein